MSMHPQIMTALASEHVKDMRAQAAAARRVREARRARRGPRTTRQPMLVPAGSIAPACRAVAAPAR